MEEIDWDIANALIDEMEAEGRARLTEGVGKPKSRSNGTADMRYRKQGFEVSIPLPDGPLGPHSEAVITAAFEDVYRQLYGHVIPDTPSTSSPGVSWPAVPART